MSVSYPCYVQMARLRVSICKDSGKENEKEKNESGKEYEEKKRNLSFSLFGWNDEEKCCFVIVLTLFSFFSITLVFSPNFYLCTAIFLQNFNYINSQINNFIFST